MEDITIVVLAAGASSRMGQPKQLLDWGGLPLVRVVAEHALAAQAAQVLVVVGGAEVSVRSALADLQVEIVANPAYRSGQSSSLRAGIAALAPTCAAAVIMLGDQPFVTPMIINSLTEVWRMSRAAIVAPLYHGQRGNPVLFDQCVFAELCAIHGDQGARAIIQADPARIRSVAFADSRPLEDIDTPADYARLMAQTGD